MKSEILIMQPLDSVHSVRLRRACILNVGILGGNFMRRTMGVADLNGR